MKDKTSSPLDLVQHESDDGYPVLDPAKWQLPDKFQHQGDHIHFILDGCRDTKHVKGGGFFPETLRSEYHEIRSVMEAYASQAAIAGRDEATACGIALQHKQTVDYHFQVYTRVGMREYVIDRWE